MEKIPSFTVNHLDLLRGVYVSRIDAIGEQVLTTYDVRMKQPNKEPVMQTAEMHTIEHLAATFLRNHKTYADDVIYFGPMGCRTGFYVILKGKRSSEEIIPLLKEMFDFISTYEGDVPGASARDCGNYLDMNLPMARYEAQKFLEETLKDIEEKNLIYPS
ncbi:S-ribosylhomocysteine lyase [Vallitalea pronyensis]|uniref:S-ribosylhomocysteine lyase n=1 Tax=Vallitalea pronyensis TaxID=1348613 RepID=A0A8J8MM05_9FIRM|nr:S-ribosylhomocysteine lyase [Vallitalea pronyensis]QUI24317.1 S-ribosylhomocysteine lyase [Vallitalea pronyensis]